MATYKRGVKKRYSPDYQREAWEKELEKVGTAGRMDGRPISARAQNMEAVAKAKETPEFQNAQAFLELLPPEISRKVHDYAVGLMGKTRRADYSIYARYPIRFLGNILQEKITTDCQNIFWSVRDYPITIARSANATGKTHAAARVAVWWYKVYEDAEVYTAAAPPESNLKNLLWGEINAIVHRHPELFKDDSVRNLHISSSPKHFIAGVSIPASGNAKEREARFSGKHAPHLLFILDEGDAIPDEVYKGIESCMSGGLARMLILFNPRQTLGSVYMLEKNQRAKGVNVVNLSAFSHPNVMSGREIVPGAVTRIKTIERVHLWTRPLAPDEKLDDNCIKIPKLLTFSVPPLDRDGGDGLQVSADLEPALPPLADTLNRDRISTEPIHQWSRAVWPQYVYRHVTEPAFWYMVLGKYPPQGETQLISRAWVEEALERWKKHVEIYGEIPPVEGIMGVDVADMGVDSNVAITRKDGYVDRVYTWSGVNTMVTADRVMALALEKKVSLVNVDATGVGAGVAPALERMGIRAFGHNVSVSPTYECEMGIFGNLRDQLWWSLREWLAKPENNAMLPPDELLVEEISTPTYAVRNGKVKVMDKDTMKEVLKRSPDRADALCMTFAPKNYLHESSDLLGIFV